MSSCGHTSVRSQLELLSITAEPGHQKLSPDRDTTVIASAELRFAVTLRNTGRAEARDVRVTLTIRQSPAPIVRSKAVRLIARETKIVVFGDVGAVQFAAKNAVQVVIRPVRGDRTALTSEPHAVIFSLG